MTGTSLFKKKLLEQFGTTKLLIFQPTPFCNLACKYCYLKNKTDNKVMTEQVIEQTCLKLFNTPLVQNNLTVVWHAGEPLVVPISKYKSYMKIIDAHKPKNLNLTYSFQSNGTLITQEWCNFIKERSDVCIGISIDGPKDIHDSYRITKSGRGTFDLVQKGLNLLRENNIPFHTISVINSSNVDQAKRMFDFFLENKIKHVSLNIEETEGVNKSASLTYKHRDQIKNFFNEFLTLYFEHNCPFELRELSRLLAHYYVGHAPNQGNGNDENLPFKIITIGVGGEISTFSPELIGQTDTRYNNFIYGNILSDSLFDVLLNPFFIGTYYEIRNGINKCKKSCNYFNICKGGSPSEKITSSNSFSTGQTESCYRKIIAPICGTESILQNKLINKEKVV